MVQPGSEASGVALTLAFEISLCTYSMQISARTYPALLWPQNLSRPSEGSSS